MLRGRRCLREILEPLLEDHGAVTEKSSSSENRVGAPMRHERGHTHAAANSGHASWTQEGRRTAGLSAGGVK